MCNLVIQFAVPTVSGLRMFLNVEKNPQGNGPSVPTRDNPGWWRLCYGMGCFQLAWFRNPRKLANLHDRWMLCIHSCRSFAHAHDLHAFFFLEHMVLDMYPYFFWHSSVCVCVFIFSLNLLIWHLIKHCNVLSTGTPKYILES